MFLYVFVVFFFREAAWVSIRSKRWGSKQFGDPLVMTNIVYSPSNSHGNHHQINQIIILSLVSCIPNYLLVMTNLAIENHNFLWDNSLFRLGHFP